MTKSRPMNPVRVQDVSVRGRLRPLREETVVALMESIERIGLLTPISVRWVPGEVAKVKEPEAQVQKVHEIAAEREGRKVSKHPPSSEIYRDDAALMILTHLPPRLIPELLGHLENGGHYSLHQSIIDVQAREAARMTLH